MRNWHSIPSMFFFGFKKCRLGSAREAEEEWGRRALVTSHKRESSLSDVALMAKADDPQMRGGA